MKIVVLGWGSLIWCPRELKIRGDWHCDGPSLPVEFARVSNDRRLTIVLFPNAENVKVLWAEMDFDELAGAIKNLQDREGMPNEKNIGCVCVKKPGTDICNIANDIKEWAIKKGDIDAVIWTNLQSNFCKKTGGKPFNKDNVIWYLSTLKNCCRKRAEEYIRRAPAQIRTCVRKTIEEKLRWTYDGNRCPYRALREHAEHCPKLQAKD